SGLTQHEHRPARRVARDPLAHGESRVLAVDVERDRRAAARELQPIDVRAPCGEVRARGIHVRFVEVHARAWRVVDSEQRAEVASDGLTAQSPNGLQTVSLVLEHQAYFGCEIKTLAASAGPVVTVATTRTAFRVVVAPTIRAPVVPAVVIDPVAA